MPMATASAQNSICATKQLISNFGYLKLVHPVARMLHYPSSCWVSCWNNCLNCLWFKNWSTD